jgi:ATP-binding cassette subfamily B protein
LAPFSNLSHVFLQLGLPSVILFGAYLLATGAVPIFTYLGFSGVAARIYNPIMDAMI